MVESSEGRKCRACRKPIEPDAQVCHLCQRDQSHSISFFSRVSGLVAAIGLAATLVGTYVSVTSARNALAEKKIAQNAADETEKIKY